MEYAKIEAETVHSNSGKENALLTSPDELARLAAMAADDKKAKQVVVLDIRSISPFSDYFVICHGSSTPQVKAIVDNVEKQLQEQFGLQPNHREGLENGRWVLLDYGDIVVHVFHEQEREFYNLERLWGDAPVLDVVGIAR